MPEIAVTADASDLGFDPGRLARLDAHFKKYVDDGRLPGWSLAVARDGEIAHSSTYGWADMEAMRKMASPSSGRFASMSAQP